MSSNTKVHLYAISFFKLPPPSEIYYTYLAIKKNVQVIIYCSHINIMVPKYLPARGLYLIFVVIVVFYWLQFYINPNFIEYFTYTLMLDYSSMMKKFTVLINTLVTTDMDFTQLEAFLSSQMKKKQVSLYKQII